MAVHYNQLARELAQDNTQYLEDYMVRQGLPKPYIRKNPALSSLPCQRIRYAYQYWKAVRDELGATPSRAYIKPSGLGIALGNICLLEPVNDGRDYRYRLFGTNIAHYSKCDLQGLTMSEVNQKYPQLQGGDGEFHLAVFQCSQEQAKPYYVEYSCPLRSSESTPWLWRRLTLPLADSEGNIIMLMNCQSPEPLRAENDDSRTQSIA